MALQFQPPNFGPPPSKYGKFAENLGGAIATLPQLWQQYKIAKMRNDLQLKQLEQQIAEFEANKDIVNRQSTAQYGTGAPLPATVNELPGMTPTPEEEAFTGVMPTMRLPEIAQPTPLEQLESMGIQKYNSLPREGIATPPAMISKQPQSPSIKGKTETLPKPNQEEKDKKFAIPGWEQTGDVTVSEKTVQDLRKGMAEYNAFKVKLADYKALINKYGSTEVLNRKAAAEMDSLAKDLQLKLKNMAQLGVLSFSDIPFIAKQIPQRGIFTTVAGTLGALDQTQLNADKTILENMKINGYRQQGQPDSTEPVQVNALPQIGQPFNGSRVVKITRVR